MFSNILPMPRSTNWCPRSHFPFLCIPRYTLYLHGTQSLLNLRSHKIVENIHYITFSFREKTVKGSVTYTAIKCVCIQCNHIYLRLLILLKGTMKMNIKCQNKYETIMSIIHINKGTLVNANQWCSA